MAVYILNITCLFFLTAFSCSSGNIKVGSNNLIPDSKKEKTLIVYLSRTKNTKAVAEIIQSKVGGNMVELELQNPYPENYKAIVDQVAKENETGLLPTLKTKIDISKYDTIFIGFPT